MLTAFLVFLLPFVLNGAMELIKWLTKVSSTGVIRCKRELAPAGLFLDGF
jgi:uncharacterized protein YqhQ